MSLKVAAAPTKHITEPDRANHVPASVEVKKENTPQSHDAARNNVAIMASRRKSSYSDSFVTVICSVAIVIRSYRHASRLSMLRGSSDHAQVRSFTKTVSSWP